MRAVVMYESMFGNTKSVAQAIAEGLEWRYEVELMAVAKAGAMSLTGVDLLVVGGPTHAWGMSRPSTRRGAADQAEKSNGRLVLEDGAAGVGLREWIANMGSSDCVVATFDTRVHLPVALSGRASTKFASALRRHGCHLATEPESFFVTRDNELVPGEIQRALSWGRELAAINLARVW